MKITKISVQKYARFKAGLALDFTYPEGHEKAGQPLEKICLIGPGGTGKTNLLNLIHYFVTDLVHEAYTYQNRDIYNEYQQNINHCILFEDVFSVTAVVDEMPGNPVFVSEKQTDTCILNSPENEAEQQLKKQVLERIRNLPRESPLIIHFGVVRPSKNNFNNPYYSYSEFRPHIYYFNEDSTDFVWQNISELLGKFQSEEMDRKKMIADAVIGGKGADEIAGLKAEYEKWRNENKNPLNKLADQHLDPMLERFGLRVKRDFDTNNILDLGEVHLEQIDGTPEGTKTFVPAEGWSTGTRNLVLTTVPLFFMEPQKAVILLDEPENSLYPDVQKKLVKLYTEDLTKDCQVFMATHSPMIAAEFEPCERFIFYFDEEGNVDFRKGTVAEGNTPDRMLEDDFEIDNLLGPEAADKWKELQTLSKEILLSSGKSNSLNGLSDKIKKRNAIVRRYAFELPILDEL